jgi:hypothetical protein
MLAARQRDVAVHVVALGFRQARGADGDDGGLVARVYVQQRFLDVVVATHDGGGLVHGAGLQRYRFLEMPHQQHQAE